MARMSDGVMNKGEQKQVVPSNFPKFLNDDDDDCNDGMM